MYLKGETDVNDNQLNWLNEKFGNQYARIKNGVAILVHTGEQIPVDNMAYQNVKADGVYRLSEATCDRAIPNGKGGRMEATTENLEKFQCKVGRRAPKCHAYSKQKCAVYFFESVDSLPLSVKPSELIKICNIA